VPVTIRLPERVVREIDEDLEQRMIPVSRNNWLLEAAIEKLQRNGSKGVRHGAE
jgi:metal-responsive CopG/Arc/MetJ family transcriptional regulator